MNIIEMQKTRQLLRILSKETKLGIRTNHWKQTRWFANAGPYQGSGDTEYEALLSLQCMYNITKEEIA